MTLSKKIYILFIKRPSTHFFLCIVPKSLFTTGLDHSLKVLARFTSQSCHAPCCVFCVHPTHPQRYRNVRFSTQTNSIVHCDPTECTPSCINRKGEAQQTVSINRAPFHFSRSRPGIQILAIMLRSRQLGHHTHKSACDS